MYSHININSWVDFKADERIYRLGGKMVMLLLILSLNAALTHAEIANLF